jgi:hypothetical protein
MTYDTYGFKISRIGMPEEPGETGAKIGEALRYFVDNYWPSIRDWIDAKDARSEFTKTVGTELWNRNGPQVAAGYIITDDDYTISEEVKRWKIEYYGDFPFTEWTYTVLEFPNDRETSFTLHGDGGFLNWFVIGEFTSADGSSDVYFHETEYSKQRKREEEEKKKEQEDEDLKRLKKHLEEEEKNKRRHGGNVGPR